MIESSRHSANVRAMLQSTGRASPPAARPAPGTPRMYHGALRQTPDILKEAT